MIMVNRRDAPSKPPTLDPNGGQHRGRAAATACPPFILLSREDLFHWKIADNGTRLFIPGCVSKTTKDCKIELWWVLAATNVLSVI